jgi:hypothetical protein
MQRLRLWLLVAALGVLAGCATQNVSHAPGTDLGTMKTFYVQKLPTDQRGIEQLFVKQLSAWGYTATAGTADKPAAPVDAIITYQDRWAWDITMYMIRLNIQVRDGKSSDIMASAESMRPSLERLDPPEMVKEVLQAALKRPK